MVCVKSVMFLLQLLVSFQQQTSNLLSQFILVRDIIRTIRVFFLTLCGSLIKVHLFFWKISHQRQNLKIFLKFKPRLNDGLLHINSISCFKIQAGAQLKPVLGDLRRGSNSLNSNSDKWKLSREKLSQFR